MIVTDISQFANMRSECRCGRVHHVPIRHIYSGNGVIARLRDVLRDFPGTSVFLIGDENTMPLARDSVLEMLDEAGCKVTEHVFPGNPHPILDEQLIGSMLVRMPTGTGLVIAIGSGTLNDLSRVISARCGIPYVIIGTAPSMDGYASAVSAVVMDGGKVSVPLCVPYAVIADSELMKTAPDVMLSSGVGDILGKYIAIRDWRLAAREKGEYYCDEIVGMIDTAVARCTADIGKIAARSPEAIRGMADTLILSGVAISMHGLSRPASGSEHQLAHHWEVALLRPGFETPLHGNLVGLGTQAACRLYQLAGEEYDLDFPGLLPQPRDIARDMGILGDYGTKEVLGVTRELFYDSFFHATSNGRYTLVTYLEERGRLADYAKRLTDEFYG